MEWPSSSSATRRGRSSPAAPVTLTVVSRPEGEQRICNAFPSTNAVLSLWPAARQPPASTSEADRKTPLSVAAAKRGTVVADLMKSYPRPAEPVAPEPETKKRLAANPFRK